MIYICPRASNCLLKLLKSLENEFRDIVVYFPANICYTFPLCCLYSKAKIRLYDIDFYSLYPDYSNITCQEFTVFVCVIPYGNWDKEQLENNRNKIKQIFGDKVFIVWDCALTFISFDILQFIHNNISVNEAFIFSFSYAKPIEIGFGAVMFTKMNINHIFPNTIDKLTTSFLVNRVDKIFKNYLDFNRVANKDKVFLCYNSELSGKDQNFIYQILEKIYLKKDFEIVLRKGEKFSYFQIIEQKINNNLFLRERISNLAIEKIGLEFLDSSELSWRMNIRVNYRDDIVDKIFSHGVFVSRLFPNISSFIDKKIYPNCSEHWKRIINIFNNQGVDYNNGVIRAMKEILNQKLKIENGNE